MHLQGSGKGGPPSTCGALALPGDNIANNRILCGRMGGRLCDAPMPGGKTCDLPICNEHAFSGGENVDFCPYHAQLAPEELTK